MMTVGYRQHGVFEHELTLEHHGRRATGTGRTALDARADALRRLGLEELALRIEGQVRALPAPGGALPKYRLVKKRGHRPTLRRVS